LAGTKKVNESRSMTNVAEKKIGTSIRRKKNPN